MTAALPLAAPEAGADARAPWQPAPRSDRTSQIRYRAAIAEDAKRRPRLLFVGDSITENWLTAGRAIWDADYAPRGAANLGFGGDRTENALWRIRDGELDGLAPLVTVVMIGTNDLERWSVPETASGIVAVVRAIREKLPATTIVLLAILPREATATAPLRARARAVDAILAATTFDAKTEYRDIGEVLLASNGTLLPGAFDGTLHPSADGYARLGVPLDRILKLLAPPAR